MIMGRLADLRESYCERIDVLVALKFPAYYTRHDRKVVWLLHQHRQAYDLWETQFGDIHTWPDGEWLRNVIREHDIRYLSEARRVFTTSQTVSKRLERFTGVGSTPLYHPPPDHELLYCDKYEPFVFYPSRIDNMKRQRLLVEAARHLESNMKIVIAGAGLQTELDHLESMIREHDLGDRVRLAGFISDEDKRALYADCRCTFFGGYDEDYGYVPLESFYSRKPIVVLDDSGGGREFVEDGRNGYIIPNDPVTLARMLDQLCLDRGLAERLGGRGFDLVQEMAISWDHVISSLLRAAGV
jgi:glycosyltransferase involved in cell wall biosynthesis